MDDSQVVQHINELVNEEHRLEGSHVGEELTVDEEARLRDIEVALDQC